MRKVKLSPEEIDRRISAAQYTPGVELTPSEISSRSGVGRQTVESTIRIALNKIRVNEGVPKSRSIHIP